MDHHACFAYIKLCTNPGTGYSSLKHHEKQLVSRVRNSICISLCIAQTTFPNFHKECYKRSYFCTHLIDDVTYMY